MSSSAYMFIRPRTKTGKYQIVRRLIGKNKLAVVAEAFHETAAEVIVEALNNQNALVPLTDAATKAA